MPDRVRVMVEPHRLTLHTDDPGQFLTAEWTADGVQVAGRIHITDPAIADQLSAFITREADDDA